MPRHTLHPIQGVLGLGAVEAMRRPHPAMAVDFIPNSPYCLGQVDSRFSCSPRRRRGSGNQREGGLQQSCGAGSVVEGVHSCLLRNDFQNGDGKMNKQGRDIFYPIQKFIFYHQQWKGGLNQFTGFIIKPERITKAMILVQPFFFV